jgi:N-acetylmuramoyl-L-alanine amidase
LAATLSGARIAIDPGHGPGDPGVLGPDGMTEADANHAAALETARALEARGARPFLVRRADTNPDVSERARAANDAGAEACLSIHLAAHDERRPPGVAAYFYGREGWESQAGHRLAASVVLAVSQELGLPRAVVEARQIAVLRETQMPACHVEPVDLSDRSEATSLGDRGFFEHLGSALATGLEAFFAGGPSFSPDGAEAVAGDEPDA